MAQGRINGIFGLVTDCTLQVFNGDTPWSLSLEVQRFLFDTTLNREALHLHVRYAAVVSWGPRQGKRKERKMSSRTVAVSCSSSQGPPGVEWERATEGGVCSQTFRKYFHTLELSLRGDRKEKKKERSPSKVCGSPQARTSMGNRGGVGDSGSRVGSVSEDACSLLKIQKFSIVNRAPLMEQRTFRLLWPTRSSFLAKPLSALLPSPSPPAA